MLLVRRSTLWSTVVRQRMTGTTYRRIIQRSSRRSYASAGPKIADKKSDLPWLAGAIAVTVPSVWYLWRDPAKPHGHEPGEDHLEHPEHSEEETEGKAPEHAKADPDKENGETTDEESSDEGDKTRPESSQDDSEKDDGGHDEDKSDESNGEGDGDKDTPEISDDEEPKNEKYEKGEGGDVEGVQGTAPRKDDAPGVTREHIPDAKGYSKKRISSDAAKPAGEPKDEKNEPDKGDKASTSKPAGDQTTTSGKQEGLSNTDTKHSTKLDDREDTPMKAEGPETAKAKGTIDPNRPQK